MDSDRSALVAIRTIHTLAWGFFVACILSMPLFALRQEFAWAFAAAALVMGEVAVLALNGYACPLTAVAARYTDDRAPNFDIYLPVWLARYNKQLFGPLFGILLLLTLVLWARAS